MRGVPEDLIFFYKHLELGRSVTSCIFQGVPEVLIFFYKHLELCGSVTSSIFSGCPRRSDIFL